MKYFDVKRSVRVLSQIRTLIRKDLDPCVIAELDAVILLLENCVVAKDGEARIDHNLVVRTMNVIGRIIESCLNLAELVRNYTDPQ